MFKMFAVMCAVTVMECNTLHEDPPRTFNTEAECLDAAVIKDKETREMLADEDGYLSVAHLEIGCENIYN